MIFHNYYRDERAQYILQGYYATKDCLILLIEASPGMFVKAEGQDDIPFSLCIKVPRQQIPLNNISVG